MVVVDELKQIPIPGDDLDRSVIGAGEGRQHVVGLETGRPHRRDTEAAQQLQNDLDLRSQGVRFLLTTVGGDPVCLIRGQQFDPPIRTPVRVDRAHQPGGALVADQSGQAIAEPPNRVDLSTVGPSHRRGDAIEGAVPQSGCVNEHQHVRQPATPVT